VRILTAKENSGSFTPGKICDEDDDGENDSDDYDSGINWTTIPINRFLNSIMLLLCSGCCQLRKFLALSPQGKNGDEDDEYDSGNEDSSINRTIIHIKLFLNSIQYLLWFGFRQLRKVLALSRQEKMVMKMMMNMTAEMKTAV
jgi:hypothetical protein